MLEHGKIDAITFTSSSTVSNFMTLLEGTANPVDLLKTVVKASIGPITSDTAKSLGIEPDIEAEEYTIAGLVDSLLKFYKKD